METYLYSRGQATRHNRRLRPDWNQKGIVGTKRQPDHGRRVRARLCDAHAAHEVPHADDGVFACCCEPLTFAGNSYWILSCGSCCCSVRIFSPSSALSHTLKRAQFHAIPCIPPSDAFISAHSNHLALRVNGHSSQHCLTQYQFHTWDGPVSKTPYLNTSFLLILLLSFLNMSVVFLDTTQEPSSEHEATRGSLTAMAVTPPRCSFRANSMDCDSPILHKRNW